MWLLIIVTVFGAVETTTFRSMAACWTAEERARKMLAETLPTDAWRTQCVKVEDT